MVWQKLQHVARIVLAAVISNYACAHTTDNVNVSSVLWPKENAFDTNRESSWSSNPHPSSNATEWIAYWWSEGFQKTNYIKLRPRYLDRRALGFPISFTIHYSDGAKWNPIVTHIGYPTPSRGDWIIIPLPGTFLADGIWIVASELGSDDVGNYVLQVSDVSAGYDPGFEQFIWMKNDRGALPGANQVGGVGAGQFHPDKLRNWNYDERRPILLPEPQGLRNIYAPQAVHQSDDFWNVYFGGWDGARIGNDQLYLTTTADNFNSFGARATILSSGVFEHVNNESVVKIAPDDWRMVYTTFPNEPGEPCGKEKQLDCVNKPAFAISTDGGTWLPNAGNKVSLLKMSGYANWAKANINGGNAIHRDKSGLWHLFFNDFSSSGGVHHATSVDFVSYLYQKKAVDETVIPQDIKAFSHDGRDYYFGVYHLNDGSVRSTLSTSLSSLGSPSILFNHLSDDDRYIVAAGVVQAANHLYGVLYGAGAAATLDQNRIFAVWLQKKVIFQNDWIRWGDIERSFGPRNVRLYLNTPDSLETGRFQVYDTDGKTLLYTSPEVTMRAGDVWSYTEHK